MAQIFTLSLDIGAFDVLRLVETRTAIVIAKPASGAPPNVAWLALRPAPRIVIRWSETYGVYASESTPRGGSPIVMSSLVYPVVDRKIYPYADGAFGEPIDDPRIPAGNYDVRNAGSTPATFGVLQESTANGLTVRGPLNAVVLPAEFTADFAPAAQLRVWTQPDLAPGSLIPQIPARAATVDFAWAHASRSCRFDPTANTFVVVA